MIALSSPVRVGDIEVVGPTLAGVCFKSVHQSPVAPTTTSATSDLIDAVTPTLPTTPEDVHEIAAPPTKPLQITGPNIGCPAVTLCLLLHLLLLISLMQ